VQLNGAAAATVLAYSSPAFTAVLAWRIFGEPLGGGKISAVVLGIIGCILVSGAYALAVWQVNPIGILTGLLSGLAFASYSLMGRSAANRSINSWLALMVSFGGAAVLLLAFNLIAAQVFPGLGSTNLFWLGDSLAGWLALLFLALGPSIGGFGLFTLSLNYLPASIASLIAILELPLTAVMAYLFLSERLNQPQLVGCVLIVGSIFLLRFADRPASELTPSISP
jgi:drug/metabolite transporter (DMT)-like permease